jgi:molybdate transport system permease protein
MRDRAFVASLALLGGVYVLLIAGMLVADLAYASAGSVAEAFASPEIRHAIALSLVTSGATAVLSLLVAVPLGYLLSRHEFRGKRLLDAVLDVPVVLPPLVVGISLLLLFRPWRGVPYSVASIVIAQFSVSAAFAVRTMRVAFDQIPVRAEEVARTLGCTRAQAFFRVVLPEARSGMLAAETLAWARALGEFGPILVFSGATRMRTEVLSTTVFLELSVGRLDAAVAVSLLMVVVALAVLVLVRSFGAGDALGRGLKA